MKLKIKVKEITPGCFPEINANGDWIDLKSAINLTINAAQSGTLKKELSDNNTVKRYRNVDIPTYYIPLGIAMQLPNGFEAVVNSRSSVPKKLGVFIPNGQGVIDNTYCGNNDQWYYIAAPMRNSAILKFDRVCQFRIQLSQKATFWQKMRWLFSSGVKLVKVDNLNNTNRGGLGSTGISGNTNKK